MRRDLSFIIYHLFFIISSLVPACAQSWDFSFSPVKRVKNDAAIQVMPADRYAAGRDYGFDFIDSPANLDTPSPFFFSVRVPDGNYRVTGRLKDMIIRGGENLYPKEIEEFLYTHPAVSDVQVIGVPDKKYGEEAMACIILKKGAAATEEEIRKYCVERLARHKVPRYIEFVDSFPMNAAGKIQKFKMREEAVKKLGLEN